MDYEFLYKIYLLGYSTDKTITGESEIEKTDLSVPVYNMIALSVGRFHYKIKRSPATIRELINELDKYKNSLAGINSK